MLVHGSPYPAQHLAALAASLATTRRVIVPDLPGYGESALHEDAVAGAQRDLEEHLWRLVELCEFANIEVTDGLG